MGVKLVSASAGSVEIVAPTTASNYTATMPARTGTVMLDGPAFSAYQSTLQSITNSTPTKVMFQTETFDTNNNFDSTTNYRFTPTVAGYYQFNWRIGCNAGSGVEIWTSIYKNGTNTNYGFDGNGGNIYGSGGSTLLYANGTTDYFEIYLNQYSASAKNTTASSSETWFNGCLIRGA